jgi:hypothetical protein
MAINEQGGAGKLRRLLTDRGWQKLLKISAPLPLIKTFGIRPLFAGSVSIDSTFQQRENEGLILFFAPTDDVILKQLRRKWYKKKF